VNQTDAVFQCVPNFSEGRDAAVVAAIADAVRQTSGALLIDFSADPDHNRSVATILGSADGILRAVLAAARVALTHIDLRVHSGAHPRLGAIDVVPVIPLRGAGPPEAMAVAEAIGAALAAELELPVYFYERNARPGREAALPALRRGGFEAIRDAHPRQPGIRNQEPIVRHGGFEAIRDAPLTGRRLPDLGPSRAHSTAGATVVGARGPLVAYNVNLIGGSEAQAREIAAAIRRDRSTHPDLAGVRALGLWLPSRGVAQISMNLTQPDRTPLPAVFAYVARQAARHGIAVLESEIIGVIPEAALAAQPPAVINWHTFQRSQILDTWLNATACRAAG